MDFPLFSYEIIKSLLEDWFFGYNSALTTVNLFELFSRLALVPERAEKTIITWC